MPDYLIFDPGTSIDDPPAGTTRPPPEVPGPAEVPAANIENWLSFELPRFLLSADKIKLGVVAVRPNANQMGVAASLNGIPSNSIFMFQPDEITVSQAITRTTTSIVVSADSLTGLLYIGTRTRGEFVKIENSISGQNYAYEVDRGVGDTIPLQHDVDTKVWRCSSDFLWQSSDLNTGTPYTINLYSFTVSARRSSARSDTYNIAEGSERHTRPICPADIKIGGQSLPPAVGGDVVITYRVRQKDAELDWYDSTTAQIRETGWEARIRLDTGAVGDDAIITRTDTSTAADGTATFAIADIETAAGASSATVTLTLSAVNGALTSRSEWQHTFMWTKAALGVQTGWHHNWGNNWGG